MDQTIFRNLTCKLCAVDGSICVVSDEFRRQSSHHTRNMNATWFQGATSGAWAQNKVNQFHPKPQASELPCKVILFLKSLVTVDTGEGAMKGAGFMSSHMGPILACHLKETHEHKGNSCLQMESGICEKVTITCDSCNWIIYFGLAMTSKVGGWNRKKTRKIQEDGNDKKMTTWNVLYHLPEMFCHNGGRPCCLAAWHCAFSCAAATGTGTCRSYHTWARYKIQDTGSILVFSSYLKRKKTTMGQQIRQCWDLKKMPVGHQNSQQWQQWQFERPLTGKVCRSWICVLFQMLAQLCFTWCCLQINCFSFFILAKI